MDEKKNEFQPPVDLPQPTLRPSAEVPLEQSPATEKSQAIAVEQGISAAGAPFSQQPGPAAMPSVALPNQPASPTSLAPAALPALADDTDLIEKEWVVKAKEIVEKTKHDPYLQNNEMSKVKADYIKKRYNKDLKLST